MISDAKTTFLDRDETLFFLKQEISSYSKTKLFCQEKNSCGKTVRHYVYRNIVLASGNISVSVCFKNTQ